MFCHPAGLRIVRIGEVLMAEMMNKQNPLWLESLVEVIKQLLVVPDVLEQFDTDNAIVFLSEFKIIHIGFNALHGFKLTLFDAFLDQRLLRR